MVIKIHSHKLGLRKRFLVEVPITYLTPQTLNMGIQKAKMMSKAL